jgi:hypothetical protein
MTEKLDALLGSAIDMVQKGMDKLPPLAEETAQQIVSYGIAKSATGTAIGALFIVGLTIGAIILTRKDVRDNGWEDFGVILVTYLVLVLLPAALFGVCLRDLLGFIYAPNVMILEAIRGGK